MLSIHTHTHILKIHPFVVNKMHLKVTDNLNIRHRTCKGNKVYLDIGNGRVCLVVSVYWAITPKAQATKANKQIK